MKQCASCGDTVELFDGECFLFYGKDMGMYEAVYSCMYGWRVFELSRFRLAFDE